MPSPVSSDVEILLRLKQVSDTGTRDANAESKS
jgi:hypothetical protein